MAEGGGNETTAERGRGGGSDTGRERGKENEEGRGEEEEDQEGREDNLNRPLLQYSPRRILLERVRKKLK